MANFYYLKSSSDFTNFSYLKCADFFISRALLPLYLNRFYFHNLALNDPRFLLFIHISKNENEKADVVLNEHRDFFENCFRSRVFVELIIEENRADYIQYFLSKNFSFNSKEGAYPPLHYAAKHEKNEVVEALLDSPAVEIQGRGKKENTLLHIIVKKNKTQAYDILVKKQKLALIINMQNTAKKTALLIAIEMRFDYFFGHLLDEPNLDLTIIQLKTGKNLLHLLAERNEEANLKKYLKKLKANYSKDVFLSILNGTFIEAESADPSKSGKRRTALMVAAEKNHWKVVEQLLCYKADFRTFIDGNIPIVMTRKYSESGLILDAAHCGNYVHNLTEKEKLEALEHCCHFGLFNKTQKLIQLKIIPYSMDAMQNNDGNNPLLIILASNPIRHTPLSESKKLELIRLLLNGTFKDNINHENSDKVTPLILAVYRGYLSIVNEFLKIETLNINAQTTDGYSALHYAIENNNLKVSIAILKAKINPNLKNKHGMTPLHLAPKIKNLELVKVLVQHGASLTIQDCKGNTPLYYAAATAGCDAIGKLLFKEGSYPTLKEGKWLLSKHAELNENKELAKILRDYEKENNLS